jgi:hypothetical protein
VLSLPMSADLTEADQDLVVRMLCAAAGPLTGQAPGAPAFGLLA